MALVLTGCGGEAGGTPSGREPSAAEVVQTTPAPESAPTAQMALEDVRNEILERVDSVDRALGTIPMLTPQERGKLRSDVNAEQIARARALGVRASDSAAIQQLLRRGRLVTLADSTPYWVLRRMEYSVPHVTPDARAMLVEVGRRFHAELDSLGLPPYRMEITSVLRTPETQADLRQSNPNASREVSAHEFGTTLDIARARFSAPAPAEIQRVIPVAAPSPSPEVQQTAAAALDSVADKHSSALQAALGRVLIRMREEGMLLVMMERQQAVYHTTVARRFRS